MSNHNPIVALVGAFASADRITGLLHATGYETVRFTDRAHFLDPLLDRYPALILTDGTDPDWLVWTKTVKKESATRRIPVLAIIPDKTAQVHVLAAGADAGWCSSPRRSR